MMLPTNNTALRARVLRSAAVVLLLVLCGMSMLKYLGWSATCGGLYGIPTETLRIRTAHWWALFYWRALIILECLSVALVSTVLPPGFPQLHIVPKWIIRVLIATSLVVLITVSGGIALNMRTSHLGRN